MNSSMNGSMDQLFEGICKKHICLSWNRAEKYAKVLKKVYEEVTLLRT